MLLFVMLVLLVLVSNVERVKGIEPLWPAWKAGALPLSYTRCHEKKLSLGVWSAKVFFV